MSDGVSTGDALGRILEWLAAPLPAAPSTPPAITASSGCGDTGTALGDGVGCGGIANDGVGSGSIAIGGGVMTIDIRGIRTGIHRCFCGGVASGSVVGNTYWRGGGGGGTPTCRGR